MYAIKLSLNNELRRVPCANPICYQELLETAKRVFPPLQVCSDFSFKWHDDEGDEIVLSSNDELQDAFQCMKSENRKTFRFQICTPDSKSIPAAAATADASSPTLQVHKHVTCDGCGMFPLFGVRFKCAVRDNYDLCASCEAKTEKAFPMIKIYNPQQEPAAIVVNLRTGPDEGSFRHCHRGRRWRETKKAQQENANTFPSAMTPAPFIAAADAFVQSLNCPEGQNTGYPKACAPFFAAVNAFVSAMPGEPQEQSQGDEVKEKPSEKVTSNEDSDIEKLMVEEVLRMSEQVDLDISSKEHAGKVEKCSTVDETSSASMSMCDVDNIEIGNETSSSSSDVNAGASAPSEYVAKEAVSFEEERASAGADAVWGKCWAREIEIFVNMGLNDTKILMPLFFEHLKNPVSITGGEVSMNGIQAIVNQLFNE